MKRGSFAIVMAIVLICVSVCACGSTRGGVEHAAAVEAENGQSYILGSDGALYFRGSAPWQTEGSESRRLAENVSQVSAGEQFALILKNDGTLWGWGSYGDGGEVLAEPEKLADGIVKISAAGYYLLALDGDGVLWDYGHTEKKPLPDKGSGVYELERPVRAAENVKAFSAGETCALIVSEGGELWRWSSMAEPEMLIDGGIADAAAGNGVFAAVREDGTLLLWGESGALLSPGHGDSSDALELRSGVKTLCLRTMTDGERSGDTLLCITDGGELWLYGFDVRTGAAGEPVRLMTGVVSVSAGSGHVLAADSEGVLYGWGRNGSGELTGTPGDRLADIEKLPAA